MVAALQPQDVQMLTAHLPVAEQLTSGKSQNSEASTQQSIQINAILPTAQADDKKSSNNNNNNTTFRIKQENVSPDETNSEVLL